MTTLIGIYLTLLSLFIVWKTGRDALQGTCPLFSTRNFFVLGLLLFQSVSGAFTMFTGESENYADVANPEFTGIVHELRAHIGAMRKPVNMKPNQEVA